MRTERWSDATSDVGAVYQKTRNQVWLGERFCSISQATYKRIPLCQPHSPDLAWSPVQADSAAQPRAWVATCPALTELSCCGAMRTTWDGQVRT
jgi:hypothetical protein